MIEATAVTGRVMSSAGVRNRRPCRCKAVRWSPRATSTVGTPACTNLAPSPPPIAPAPMITYLRIHRPYVRDRSVSERIEA
ncbi:hypothetical protein GCM10022204_42140 [Microlunatus aurantiacus]|uniref:Uncharacterized protein n=1 Tax=Microlunatus aurantiacus TaxID=446786 RepID=A0ABP7EFW0_9ACTN